MDNRQRIDDIINGLQFSYIEVFSIMRNPQSVIVSGKSRLFNKKNGRISNDAEKTHSFKRSDKLVHGLLKVLKIPYENHSDWMCAPIYRDAIVFRDENDQVVLPLNICFECLSLIHI